ncbi:hypothetical protein MTR67_022050 [Solanum verrucosum]|uniref:Reverse transcriptase zinc-binding domain-containing protein n=1 Tax=Solanum verrucosum TaxID=315347 RepID=A0AAF0QX23_SOLVR|nr:hypothetical protein MTR67_022050 [Solanum verrucosum]
MRSLWESFENHSLRNAKPWLALGDFNSVLKSEDRLGGNPVTWAEVIEFQNCIDRMMPKSKLLLRTGFALGTFPIRIKTGYVVQLSYAGRLQIINVVLFSIHNFWGAVFILPQSVLKQVDKICREYLWGTTNDRKKISLVTWDKICCPKKTGGLNIRGCMNWNIASVGKLLWFILWLAEQRRLLTKERLANMHIPVGDSTCCLCDGQQIEITKHLFAECDWFKQCLSQFMHSPKTIHMEATMRVVKYVKHAPGLGILMRSVTDYLVQYGTSPISWKSKKQVTVSRSLAEVKYRTMTSLVAKECSMKGLSCHGLSLHPGRGRYSRTIVDPQANPHPG